MPRLFRPGAIAFVWGAALAAFAQSFYPTGVVEVPGYPISPPRFVLGESLSYEFRWNGIRAAEGEIVAAANPVNSDQFHLRAAGRTVGLARLLWKMEDSAESFCWINTLKPELFRLEVREPSLRYDLEVFFDHAAGRAAARKIRGEKVKPREIEFHYAYDPLSLVFLVRSLEWKAGDERRFELVDGQDRYLLILQAVAEEEIKVPVGVFPAVKFIPALIELPRRLIGETPTFFERLRRREAQKTPLIQTFEFWMAKDIPRPFLRVRSDAWIGHVDMELTRISYPGDSTVENLAP